jgi:DNA-binding CsgD family transcriptional regulator
MANSLQSIFPAIAQAKDEQELRSQLSTNVSQYFAAKRWGLFFFNQLPFADSNFQKALEFGLSIKHNPVLRYLVERHAPVHEELVVSPKAWQLICPRADHRHVMAGPIVSNGRLVGTIGFTREQGSPAFNAQNLTDLSALCMHICAWLSTVRSHRLEYGKIHLDIQSLTSREVQIAELVAEGLTNAEIGAALWIQENSVKQALKRMFRKLDVSSRAEMVARLYKSATRKSDNNSYLRN